MGSYKLREEGGAVRGIGAFLLERVGEYAVYVHGGVMFERSCRVFYGTYIV